ncbi:glycosyltransferase family 117 protein [Pedobacter metabolipauper]|uniref:Uncharacterized protein DUF2723 n=1 Tax=Pedobacter metabolipauper TaxID=425513 RepID=A0A4V3D1E9_9SPHI|nr:DUF2723 domain-containing protein [Pedobacter metabolipauper]TDQ10963.1 uncharacterized protein DUF2723 [Pedobacter metabolipauper]
MKSYQKINNLTGFALFGVAVFVYWMTMEPTLSFWDCGEFIAASFKMQVGHQPGAPLFLMIGKLFSLLAIGNTAKIAYWMNFSSVIFSAATVMFLYWTITRIASKLYDPDKKSITDTLAIVATGIVGALSFTFSDTFWFSAVEAEVYSLSILFTALVFWAILKWESNLNDRWLVLIAFIIGLSIGAHLLSLLAIPAVVLVYYFKKTDKISLTGIVKALAVSGLIWAAVQFVIIQYFVLIAAKFDMFFVNSLGLNFGSGALFFFILLIGLIAFGIHYSVKHKLYNLNLGMICLTFVVFGFSSYFLIIIRANAKPSLNLSNPDNALSLYGYLGRTNYGQTPLLYGQTFDAQTTDVKEKGIEYAKGKDKYVVSGKSLEAVYDKNILFPRTYSNKPEHVNFYKQWLNIADGQTPSFAQNLSFFASYQMGFMYWRYFLWNFAGRQNDAQGQGNFMEGNWITGIKAIDAIRLGNQDHLPLSITDNEGHNKFYGMPLLLGIAGLIFLYRKNKKDTLIVTTLFVFTGLAIIVYLNQDPLQVRERDYAYVGSFYAFTIFIGFGVLAIRELLSRLNTPKLALVAATVTGLLAAPVIMGMQGWDEHDRSGKTTALEWASNYLNSCAPNAILFTNADNDTFPLWYAQEVEGIRTDVRVVNLQYLSDHSYIDQMKKQMNQSAPLPIKMTEDQYRKGSREYMPYVDYGFTDSVELKDLLAVLTSDDKADKVELSGGPDNFLPTKNFKLTVDVKQVVQTNTVAAKDQGKIVPVMKWSFNKNFAGKADLAMIDILVNNNWERPVYFGTSLSKDTYIGLDKYLYLEGYAYRLLPLKTDTVITEQQRSDQTNSDVMYVNLMQKFSLKGFKGSKYMDPESRRIAQSTLSFANTLASNLYLEGKTDKARNVMAMSIKDLPLKNYSIEDTLTKLQTVQNLYLINDIKQANLMAKETLDYLDQELAYIASMEPNRWDAYSRNIQVGFYVMNGLAELTAAKKQTELNKLINEVSKRIEQRFS